jgi:RHS repeat-associated protein
MVDAAGTTGYTYDSAGRLSTVTDVHGKTITYSYNDCGLRSGWTDQFGGTQSFSYSNMHALTSLTDRNSEQTSYQYDTGGRLSKITLANTAYTDYAYNNRNFVTSVTNRKSDATVISSYSYQYDSVGNPTKMTEANGDYTDYGYDNVYQLTSEVMKDSGGTTIYSISWTYDNVRNRATETKDGNQTSYTYNNMNQMSAAGNTTFTYDSNGNTASKTESTATTNYTWDYENRLTKIDNPSGDDYVYEYDGDGMRVRAGHDSGQGNVWDTRFYYDTGAPLYSYLFESDNNKNMTAAYTVDPYGRLISQRRSGATYYYLYDQLGSARKLLDSSQATTDSYSYYAFGEARTSSGSTTNPFKFVGRLGYYDSAATGLEHLRARYYETHFGRLSSTDPSVNFPVDYRYVANQAARRVDPSGLFRIDDLECHFEAEVEHSPNCDTTIKLKLICVPITPPPPPTPKCADNEKYIPLHCEATWCEDNTQMKCSADYEFCVPKDSPCDVTCTIRCGWTDSPAGCARQIIPTK